jgi:2-dehydro-3-deoxyphosphogalactonate aldolase
VFPPQVLFLPVGGITPQNLVSYRAAGASGFGLGSALYKPGMTPQQVSVQARAFVAAWLVAAVV